MRATTLIIFLSLALFLIGLRLGVIHDSGPIGQWIQKTAPAPHRLVQASRNYRLYPKTPAMLASE